MSKNIVFSVDGKQITADDNKLTVAEILKRVGTSTEQCCIVSDDGKEHQEPDERIEIRDGEKFQTKPRRSHPTPAKPPIHYKVNGEEQSTQDNTLTVEMILKNAGAAASVDVTQIGSYFLERIADGRKYENLTDKITIEDGDQFVAVHAGKTPVA